MLNRIESLAAIALLSCLALPLAAQPPDPGPVRAALEPASGFIGTWKGSGWIQLGPDRREEFEGTETVRYQLDDTILLIEGVHHAKGMPPDEAPIVHHALAVLSWNSQAGYTLTSWLANGRNGAFPATLEDGRLTWTMDAGPMGKIRYTSSVEGNRWRDVGERSADGENWVKFFEMTLTKGE